MPRIYKPYRELIGGSPLVAALDTDAPEVGTFTASEPGTLDLRRTVIYAGMNTKAIYPTLDVAPYIEINGISVFGSIELVRGRNTPSAAGSIFHPLRAGGVVYDLGQWRMNSGDTVAFTVETQGTNIIADFCWAAPFIPANPRKTPSVPARILSGPSLPWAAPINSDIAAAGDVALTWTADEDGVADLSSIVLRSQSDEAAESEGGSWEDGLPALSIDGIQLPSRNQLVVGQNTPQCPGLAFSGLRTFTWFDLGLVKVNAGDTIVLDATNNGPDIANVSGVMKYWPRNELRPTGQGCPPTPPC